MEDMRISLVDDEQLIVDGLRKILSRQFPEAEVVTSTDPASALKRMETELPDLLITDLRMPEITGLELIARARKAGVKYCAVLTGLDEVPLLQESIRLQVCDYLIKPVNKKELFDMITRVQEQIRQEDDRQINTLAQQFCLGNRPDEQTGHELAARIARSDFPPVTLDNFIRAAGRMIPFWEVCRQAALPAAGKISDSEFGAWLRNLPAVRTAGSPEIREIVSILHRDYQQELTVGQLAATMYVQPNYFTTLFKKETGIGFIQYLNRIRIEEACRKMLSAPGLSMQEIAELCGFPSPRHFYTVFKKMTGMTPGAFQNEMEQAGFIRR